MSVPRVKDEKNETKAKKDITWEVLIQDAEAEIKLGKARILALERSIRFFAEQKRRGLSFPRM